MAADALISELAELAVEALADSVVTLAQGVFGAMACSLAVLDEEADELIYVAAAGQGADQIIGVRPPTGTGLAGWVVQSGQPISASNLIEDKRFARDGAESTGYVPAAMFVVPVESEDRVVGVLSVLDRDASRSGAAGDLELAARFAEQAATALAARAAFTDASAVLLSALSRAADEGSELADALSSHSKQPGDALAEISVLLGELNRAGDDERRLGVGVLSEVLKHTRHRR